MAFPIGTWAGGLYGEEMSKEDRRRAREEMERALDEFQRIKAPTRDELSYRTEDIPFLMEALSERAEQAGPSAYEGISTDPALRSAQFDALTSLQRLGEGEMTAMDRARLADIQRSAGMAERGSRGAIAQGMQRRGMGGSGLELAAQMQNQQASADRASREGLGVEAMAQQRALEALGQRGAMAGRMESEDFRKAAQRAEAADTIAKFNAMQRAGAQQRNVGSQMDVQRMRQEMAMKNTGARNIAAQDRAGAAERAFKAQMARAQGTSGGYKDLSGASAKRAQDIQRLYTGMGASADQSFAEDETRMANLFGSIYGGGMGG